MPSNTHSCLTFFLSCPYLTLPGDLSVPAHGGGRTDGAQLIHAYIRDVINHVNKTPAAAGDGFPRLMQFPPCPAQLVPLSHVREDIDDDVNGKGCSTAFSCDTACRSNCTHKHVTTHAFSFSYSRTCKSDGINSDVPDDMRGIEHRRNLRMRLVNSDSYRSITVSYATFLF
jgi:hypothetical protein